MTKDEFLARCENAWQMGLCTPERLRLMERWLDFVLRFEGGQMAYVADFMEAEMRRNNGRLVGWQADGYALNVLASILTHPCQECAVDPNAWHTLSAFCEHGKGIFGGTPHPARAGPGADGVCGDGGAAVGTGTNQVIGS